MAEFLLFRYHGGTQAMVSKIFKWFSREWSGLHQAALLLGISSLGSQLLALVRDRLLASRFGAGRDLDIYYASFRVPDLLYVTIASFVSATVLIPIIVGQLKEGQKEKAQVYLSGVMTLFAVVLLGAAAILWVLAPAIAPYLAPGFSSEQTVHLIQLMRVLLLSPFFLGLSNLFSTVTQSTKKFFIYALSPILYNVGIIFGIIFFYPRFGLIGLAYGVILGAFIHFAIQIPTVYQSGLLPWPTLKINWREVREMVLISLPRTLTLSANQLSFLFLVSLASLYGAGAVAVFNFAYNLQTVPLSIVGISYSVAAFPVLVRLFSAGEKREFLEQMAGAMRHIIFWSMPAMVMLVVLRAQVVRVILGAGQFDWRDTRLTAAALALFAISLVGQSLLLLFVRGYYACGRTRRPLAINVASSALIIILAWVLSAVPRFFPGAGAIFEQLLRVSDVDSTPMLVLPLAFTVGVLVNVWLYWHFFQKDFGRFPAVVGRAVGQSVLASILSGVVSYQALNLVAPLVDLNTFAGIFIQGLLAGCLGLGVFVLILKYFDNEELKEIERSLKQKFWRQKPIAPEPEGL